MRKTKIMEQTKKFIATHLAGTTEKSFATEQEAINHIDSVICEPGCKHCWAEWDIDEEDENNNNDQ